MKKIAVFYASKTGVTEKFAKQIAEELQADIHDIGECEIEDLAEYQHLIFASSHYGFGYLYEDWAGKIKLLNKIDFTGKKVALVGIGSQERHADSFCSGLADFVNKLGLTQIYYVGYSPVNDYNFTFSRAQFGDRLIGLCLDEADGESKNNERIQNWLKIVRPEFN